MLFPYHDSNPTVRSPFVNYALIATNCILFVWMLQLPEPKLEQVLVHRGFIPARVEQLQTGEPIEIRLGVEQVHPVAAERPLEPPVDRRPSFDLQPVPSQIYASLFTCMFLHGGWMHLIGNMWFLFIFGNNIEDRLGHVLFAFFYLAGGLAATAVHWFTDPASETPVIGASGAIAAVLGAYAVTYPFARVRCLLFVIIFITFVELPALVVLGVWFLGQLLEARGAINQDLSGGVAWWAHIGGFVAGAVVMPLLASLVPDPHKTQRRNPYGGFTRE